MQCKVVRNDAMFNEETISNGILDDKMKAKMTKLSTTDQNVV